MCKRKLVATIDEDVFMALKIYAATERITMSSLVEDALKGVLDSVPNNKSNEPAPKITQNNYGLRRIRKTRTCI